MSGVKLASGYIELTVKKAGNAMKDITAEITGIGKQADKAGEAINKGISKGAKDAGKSIRDEITAGAEKAGADAGKKAGGALTKEITKGAKDAGKSINDEIGKATRGSRDSIVKDLGGAIIAGARAGAKDAGVDLDRELVNAAGKAGAKVGQVLHDTIASTPLGDMFKGLDGVIQPAIDGIRGVGDAIVGIRDGDAAGAINGVADALKSIGQSGAGDAVHDLAGKVAPLQTTFSNLKTQIDGSGQLLRALGNDSPGIAGKLGQIGTAASAVAGPLAAAAAAALQIDQALHIDSNTFDPGQHGWWHVLLGKSADWLGLADPSNGLDKHLTPTAPAQVQGPKLVSPPPSTADYGAWYNAAPKPQTVLPPLPTRAKGGVTPAGMIFGPGTGTSDSIIGVGADGVPTARVSAGEGVVRKSAMDRGADKYVTAFNAGWLPGFDSGTGLGGVPKPDPMQQRWMAAMQRGFNPSAPLGGGAGEGGLQNNSIRARRLIQNLFPEITNIGGYRPPDGFNEHASGQALDFMIPGWNTPQGKALGDQLSNFLMQNAGSLGLDYTIWQHGQHNPDGTFQMYGDRGNPTQNHMDHVHSHSIASGYPGKDQQFFLPPQLQAMLGGSGSLGASITGAPDNPADLFAMGAPGGKDQRAQGYIPAGAGGGGAAGSSFFSGALQMGAQAINGLIDQAASAASSAASMGANAFAPGSGGAAGAAASTAIGIGTQAAKRGVQYGFQMAGIGGDALAEILMPFGVPRFFQTDPSQFMPQLPGQAAAVTTGEKAAGQQEGLQTPSPSGPVQPGQMPGQQVVGKPVPLATPGTGDLNPAPPPNAPGLSPSPAGPAVPNPAPNPAAPPVPQSGPMAQPQPPAPPIKPTDLGGLLGVYDTGGWLMPGGIAANMTNKPEPILNDDQWGNLHAIAAQGMPTPDPKAVGGAGNDYSMHFGEGSIIVKDVNELQRELDSRQRLQRWRYGGRP